MEVTEATVEPMEGPVEVTEVVMVEVMEEGNVRIKMNLYITFCNIL